MRYSYLYNYSFIIPLLRYRYIFICLKTLCWYWELSYSEVCDFTFTISYLYYQFLIYSIWTFIIIIVSKLKVEEGIIYRSMKFTVYESTFERIPLVISLGMLRMLSLISDYCLKRDTSIPIYMSYRVIGVERFTSSFVLY
jgi:hypothetical protein